MEHFELEFEQTDDKSAAIKLDINDAEPHLHTQLNAGGSEAIIR